MKHTIRKWTALILCAVMLISSFVSTVGAAETITDEGWTRVAITGGTYGCTSAQGMAVGETYLYSSMVGGDSPMAVIWRIHKDTGAIRTMKVGDTEDQIFTGLGHVNDMDVAVIDGVEYLFVLASGNDIATGNIVAFEVDGRRLHRRAQYTLHYNGGNFNPAGMAVYEVDGREVTFAFKWSNTTISLGTASLDKEEERIPVSILCYLDSTAVEVNGKKRNFTGFANQGISIHGNTLFAVYAGCYNIETVHQSLILGFDLGQVEEGTPTIRPREDMIFYFESSDYPRCFEAEDCGISSDGKLYFNVNCWKSTEDTNYDGAFVLNDFVMPEEEENAPATEPPVTEPPVTEPPVTEPTATEPPATEPTATEPTATEPTTTEPSVTEPPVEDTPIVAIVAIAVAVVAVIVTVTIVLKKKKK